MDKLDINREAHLFNTPLEVGLRCLLLLSEIKDKSCDLQRLIYYDYFLVHYGDVDDNYKSLHPNTPHRSGEVLVKREIVAKGLLLMSKKQLVNVDFKESGIIYIATEFSSSFLNYFESNYIKKLRKFSELVISRFDSYSDEELRKYMSKNIDRWGGEFSKEALFRGCDSYE